MKEPRLSEMLGEGRRNTKWEVIENDSLIPVKATCPLIEIKIAIDGSISILVLLTIFCIQKKIKLKFELYFLYLFSCTVTLMEIISLIKCCQSVLSCLSYETVDQIFPQRN